MHHRLPLTALILLALLAPAWAEDTLLVNAARFQLISPAVRGQNTYRTIGQKGWDAIFPLTRGSMARGLAGGLDADTYDWRDRDSGSEWGARRAMPTTLEFLEKCRDYDCAPMITANMFAGGERKEDGRWLCQADEPGKLAADWLRYCNFIVPTIRLGQEDQLTEDDRRILDSITGWDGRAKLLSPSAKPTPPVKYWEIGNEPEIGSIAKLVDAHHLNPEQYAERYAEMARALRTVDPTVQIGPCLMYTSKGARDYLLALKKRAVAIDFVSYHPYYHALQNGWGDEGKLAAALAGFKPFLANEARGAWSVVGRNTPLVASEWNPMMWNASGQLQRSMAMGMGIVEGILSFAEQGIFGSMYWEQPQFKPSVRAMYFALTKHLGTHMLAVVRGNDENPAEQLWRVYVTAEPKEKTATIWGLNFQTGDDATVEKTVVIHNWPFPVNSAKVRTYAGPANRLMDVKGLKWTDSSAEVETVDGTLRVTISLPPASVSVIVLSDVSAEGSAPAATEPGA
jgi:hypothetical protein